jgi:hypothetical protein
MFQAFWAYPEQISAVDDIEEGVTREDAPGVRYNVLTNPGHSELPPHGPIERKLWFNQDTGMLERIEYCDPTEKSQFGSYSYISFAYTNVDGVYIPTRIVSEAPAKGNRFVEEYSQVSVQKRAAESAR